MASVWLSGWGPEQASGWQRRMRVNKLRLLHRDRRHLKFYHLFPPPAHASFPVHSLKLVTLVCVSRGIMVDLFILFVCFFVKMPQRIQQSSFIFFPASWLVWSTTVGTALSLCQSFLPGPASQLIAGVAVTITKLRNYDNEGVDRNSPLMSTGGFHLSKMYRGGNFDVTGNCVICLVITDKYISCVYFHWGDYEDSSNGP